jgi:hypothetical protein
MSKQILQVNFKIPQEMDLSDPEAQKGFIEAANFVADFPGIRWKIWTFNEKTRESGGIYLFEDEASLKAYLDGPIISQVKSGQFADVSIKQFETMDELTEITRGPVK